MRAWDETEDVLRRAAERRDAEHEETLRELDEEGVALDPPPPGQHRHGDVEHASDHAHPHAHSVPGGLLASHQGSEPWLTLVRFQSR